MTLTKSAEHDGWTIFSDCSITHKCKSSITEPFKCNPTPEGAVCGNQKCMSKTTPVVNLLITSVRKAFAKNNNNNHGEVSTMSNIHNVVEEDANEDLNTAEDFATEIGFDSPEDVDTDEDYEEEEEGYVEPAPVVAAPVTTSSGRIGGGTISGTAPTVAPTAPKVEAPVAAVTPNQDANQLAQLLMEKLSANPELVSHILNDTVPAKKERKAADPGSSDVSFEIVDSPKDGFCQLKFSGKPDDEIRTAMKSGTFRWNGKTQMWYGPVSGIQNHTFFAAEIAKYLSN